MLVHRGGDLEGKRRVFVRSVVPCAGTALAAIAAAIIAAVLAGGGSAASAGESLDSPGGGLHATIRTTSHGIPHILASNFAGLGYGYGYVAAKANICVLAETYVTANAERSRWFGPDATYTQGGNGATQTNLNSDFFYQRIKDRGVIADLLALEPPRGPRPEIKEGVRGYVAGYNRWLRDTGVDNIDDPRCQGAPWVRPITEMDAYQRFYQLGPDRQPGRRHRRHRRRGAAGRRRADAPDRRRAGADDRPARRAPAARRHRLERLRPRP